MQPKQQLLWPDARPLVERLGRDFFRSLPERPGVYLMRDAGETVLYVGKAKNLRQRLGSYRVANPERMPRRHLRLLRLVVRIELQECDDEQAALSREAELLCTLQPRFNRAGTWPGKTRFVAWRITKDVVELGITESPETRMETLQADGVGGISAVRAVGEAALAGVKPCRQRGALAGRMGGRTRRRTHGGAFSGRRRRGAG